MSELFTVRIVEIGSVTCAQCDREWDTNDANDMVDYELHHECEGCNAEPSEPCREGCLSTVV
jgi:hypothetical protein